MNELQRKFVRVLKQRISTDVSKGKNATFKKILSQDYEEALQELSKITFILKSFFLGFYDEDIEEMLKRIGNGLFSNENLQDFRVPEKNKGKPRVAVIFSTFPKFGGHAVHTKRWLELVKDEFDFTVFITNIYNEDVAGDHIEELKSFANVVIFDKGLPFSERVRILQNFLMANDFNVVFSAHNANGVIAASALYPIAERKKLKVLYFWHDNFHPFWVGQGFSECTIYSFPFFRKTIAATLPRKAIKIPLVSKGNKHTDELSCTYLRNKLSIPKNATIIISAGNFQKIFPFLEYNFFRIMNELLSRYKDLYFILVLSSFSKPLWRLMTMSMSRDNLDKIRLLNPTPQLSEILKCANFLLDTFPKVGPGVASEALGVGLPVISYENKIAPFINNFLIDGEG